MNVEKFKSIVENMQGVDAKTVYGEPVHKGDRTVVPVASVAYGFGGGGNKGAGAFAEDLGGGGGLMANPIGFLEIDDVGTRFTPIADYKKLLGAFMVGVTVGMLFAGKKRM